jgi:hypothetical protein
MHCSAKHVHSKCNVRTRSSRSPQKTANTLAIFCAINGEIEGVAQDLPELQAGYYWRINGMGVGESMMRNCFLYKRCLVHADCVLLAISSDAESKKEANAVTTSVFEVFGEVSHELFIVLF